MTAPRRTIVTRVIAAKAETAVRAKTVPAKTVVRAIAGKTTNLKATATTASRPRRPYSLARSSCSI